MFTCESPFQLGRRVRKGTYKTVSDAWNRNHGVPLRESYHHLTNSISSVGCWSLVQQLGAPRLRILRE